MNGPQWAFKIISTYLLPSLRARNRAGRRASVGLARGDGRLAPKPVLQTLVREADAPVELQVGADTVQATPEHPFWANGAWTNVGDLVKGDELLRSDGLAMLGVDFNGSNYCQLEDIGCACTFRGAMPLAQAAV